MNEKDKPRNLSRIILFIVLFHAQVLVRVLNNRVNENKYEAEYTLNGK